MKATLLLTIALTTPLIMHAAPTSELIGSQIIRKGFDYNEEWKKYDTLPFNGMKTGTSIAIAISIENGKIISFDDDTSELIAFRDDKGTDLLKVPKQSKFGSDVGFGSFPKVSDGGQAMILTIETTGLPAPGATQIGVAGKAALVVATEAKSVEAKAVQLKVGQKTGSAPYDFKITDVGKPDWGDAELKVTFETNRRLDSITEIIFTDAAGNTLETSTGSSSTMSFGNSVQADQEISFTKKPAGPVNMKITYWADMKTVEVPFKLKTSVGPTQ